MQEKKLGTETLTGMISIIFSAIGLFMFMLGFSTGYYTFGQNSSWLVFLFIIVAILLEVIAVGVGRKFDNKIWANIITYGVTACLAAAALLIVADRVEGIGNCIVTDYDSGHGGEQAIYASIGGVLMLLAAMVFNIIGSFAGNKDAEDPRKIKTRVLASGIAAVVVFVAVFVPSMSLAGYFGGGSASGSGSNSASVYTVSYSQESGNVEEGVMPDYQFLCSDFSGFVRADARFYVEVELDLDGDTYTIKTDAYVMESGKRAEIGDDTGLGLILTMEATGTYTDNGDGTVTTAAPDHAVFEMETDTYSAQMKEAAGMNVNGATDDGVYDSNDEPAVLDMVPATIWTLGDGTIETYCKADGSDEAEAPEEETEETDSEGSADGLLVKSDDGSTQITFRADGTYAFEFPEYSVVDEGTYTYDGSTLTVTNANGDEMTADGDPLTLHYVSSLSDALTGDFTIDAADLASVGAEADTTGEESTSESSAGGTIKSDDGSTQITFNSDGTYVFEFPDYNVEDAGTYTYDGSTLTVTNANGDEMTADSDPLTLHYVSSLSDALTGDFTIDAAALQ
jgi:hypothetical protein